MQRPGWNWGPGGTSSSKAQNPPFSRSVEQVEALRTNLILSEGLPPLPAVDPLPPPVGSTFSASRVDARDAYAMNWNLNVPQQLGRDYVVEVAYVGTKGRQLTLKTDQNRAPPVHGVTDPNVNRPYRQVSPDLRTVSTVESSGRLDYHALLVRFQRRFANGSSFSSSYASGKAIDLNSQNAPRARHLRAAHRGLQPLQPPAVRAPNAVLGSSGFGAITAMLSNPACATCGTTERQIQFGVKLQF